MSERFEVFETPIAGLTVLRRKRLGDSRGYLERMFCASELEFLAPGEIGIAQVNRTVTPKRGTLRGLHFQHQPHAEGKLVSCLQGEVFDVAVDLRRGSPTFLRWHAEILSAENHTSMFIPKGFAHGFQTLTGDCGMLYFHTAFHTPGAEGGINAQDPALGIVWPLEVSERSPRDASHPAVGPEFHGVPV
jgi:dTDP-4-dehydrorhamnose 3,5-epimerase